MEISIITKPKGLARMTSEKTRHRRPLPPQEVRDWLTRGHFRIPADPVPFVEGTRYRTQFKIGSKRLLQSMAVLQPDRLARSGAIGLERKCPASKESR